MGFPSYPRLRLRLLLPKPGLILLKRRFNGLPQTCGFRKFARGRQPNIKQGGPHFLSGLAKKVQTVHFPSEWSSHNLQSQGTQEMSVTCILARITLSRQKLPMGIGCVSGSLGPPTSYPQGQEGALTPKTRRQELEKKSPSSTPSAQHWSRPVKPNQGHLTHALADFFSHQPLGLGF